MQSRCRCDLSHERVRKPTRRPDQFTFFFSLFFCNLPFCPISPTHFSHHRRRPTLATERFAHASSWSVGEWERRSATPSSLPVAGPSSSISGQGSVQRHTRALQRSQRTHKHSAQKGSPHECVCVLLCVCDTCSAVKSARDMQNLCINRAFYPVRGRSLTGQPADCAETGCYSCCAAILE